MAHINVTIAGRTYRMACGEGEEGHLGDLANGLDARIAQMRATFGEIGDMRLHVMAALTLADELDEVRRRCEAQGAELAALKARAEAAEAESALERTRIAESLGTAAARIEDLTTALSAPGPRRPE